MRKPCFSGCFICFCFKSEDYFKLPRDQWFSSISLHDDLSCKYSMSQDWFNGNPSIFSDSSPRQICILLSGISFVIDSIVFSFGLSTKYSQYALSEVKPFTLYCLLFILLSYHLTKVFLGVLIHILKTYFIEIKDEIQVLMLFDFSSIQHIEVNKFKFQNTTRKIQRLLLTSCYFRKNICWRYGLNMILTWNVILLCLSFLSPQWYSCSYMWCFHRSNQWNILTSNMK